MNRPVAFSLGSIVSVQAGSAIGAGLLDELAAPAVVSLRLGGAALVLLVIRRRSLVQLRAAVGRDVAFLGVALAVMNVSFYEAIDRIPLASAVTVELLGPLGLALGLARTRRDLSVALLALTGVAAIGGTIPAGEGAGILFALIAAGGWAASIVLNRRVVLSSGSLDGLSIALLIGAAATLPLGAAGASMLITPATVAMVVGVVVLSALVPLSLDALGLRSMTARTYGLLMSLSPVAAALSGFVLLDQTVGAVAIAGGVLVMGASGAGAFRASAQR